MEENEKKAIRSLAVILIAGLSAASPVQHGAADVVSRAEAIATELERAGHLDNVWALAGGEPSGGD